MDVVTTEDRARRWMREAVSRAQLRVVRGSPSPLIETDGAVNRYVLAEACAAELGMDILDEDVAELLWDAAFDVHDEVERGRRRSA